jgi:hypothetical protein
LNGWYLPTPKNTPVKDFYRQHGFGLVGEDDNGGELWELDPIGSDLEIPNWLSVQFISEMVGLGSSTEKQVA